MKGVILLGALALGLAGCTTTPKRLYEWGSYQSDLLRYSKNPSETKKFSDGLLASIEKAEAVHRVPPGLYAEYGYTLLDQGNTSGATVYFAKERDLWPESAELMNRLITRLNKTPAHAEGAAQ